MFGSPCLRLIQGDNMTENKRWLVAQEYEKEWWEERKDRIDFDFYEVYASELLDLIDGIMILSRDTSILEIGSGAGGIITFLDSDDRHAVDPLEDFYASVPRFRSLRDERVAYRKAEAEDLPFEDDRFDFIINDNVLDHCSDVNRVFSEMRRVLRQDGKVYLRLNLYTQWGKGIRFIVEMLKIDPGHPYTFTRRSMKTHFHVHGFEIVERIDSGFLRTWRKEIHSRKIKEMLKALTFSTPNKTLFLLRKTSRPPDEKE